MKLCDKLKTPKSMDAGLPDSNLPPKCAAFINDTRHLVFRGLCINTGVLHWGAKRMHVGKFGAHQDSRSHISRSTAPISKIETYIIRCLDRAFTLVFRDSFDKFRACYRQITKDRNIIKIAEERSSSHFTIIKANYMS